MKYKMLAVILLVAMTSLSAYASATGQTDNQVLQNLMAKMMRLNEQENSKALTAMYSAEAVIKYPDEEPIHGKQSIEKFYEEVFISTGEEVVKKIETETLFLNVEIPFAFYGVRYKETISSGQGPAEVHRGRFVTLWHRVGEKWLIVFDTSYSDE